MDFASLSLPSSQASISEPPSAHPDCDALPSPTGAKTLALLDLLSRHPEGLSSTEAARRSGFTPNLVFRILKTMVATGFAAQREDDKAYVLTHRLLSLSSPRVGERSLVLCAHEGLRALRDATGETVQLVVESDGKALVLEQFRGTQALQVCGEVGMRVPLHSCAPGKALLAAWSEERFSAWLKGRTLKAFTPATLARREDLRCEMERIREAGYAEDRAEGIEGIHCLAAALADPYGQPVGAVTLMAPAARMPEGSFPRFGEACLEAKGRIEEQFRR